MRSTPAGLWCALQRTDLIGRGYRLDRRYRQGARNGGDRGGSHRSPVVSAGFFSGPDGRRHCGWFGATFRGADGVWWSTRSVRGSAGESCSIDAWAHRWCQYRFSWSASAPPCAADPGAAHPAREGDIEHLHCAGAAGKHRWPLRSLARTRGADPYRGACASSRLGCRSRLSCCWS